MPSSDIRSSVTSAQNPWGKNFQKFTCSNFRGFIFHSSYFCILVVGCENFLPILESFPPQYFPAIWYACVSSAVYAKLCSQGLKYKNTKTHTTWCTLSSLSQPTNQTFSLLVGMVLRLERTSLTQRPVLVDADRVRRIPASIAVELDHSLQCVCVCVCVCVIVCMCLLLYMCVCYCVFACR